MRFTVHVYMIHSKFSHIDFNMKIEGGCLFSDIDCNNGASFVSPVMSLPTSVNNDLLMCMLFFQVRGSIKAVKNRYSIESSLKNEKVRNKP